MPIKRNESMNTGNPLSLSTSEREKRYEMSKANTPLKLEHPPSLFYKIRANRVF